MASSVKAATASTIFDQVNGHMNGRSWANIVISSIKGKNSEGRGTKPGKLVKMDTVTQSTSLMVKRCETPRV